MVRLCGVWHTSQSLDLWILFPIFSWRDFGALNATKLNGANHRGTTCETFLLLQDFLPKPHTEVFKETCFHPFLSSPLKGHLPLCPLVSRYPSILRHRTCEIRNNFCSTGRKATRPALEATQISLDPSISQ